MIAYTRDVIAMRRAHPVLRTGSLCYLHGERNCIAYARFDSRETVIVIFSIHPENMIVSLPVWQAETAMECSVRRVFQTDEEGYSLEEKELEVSRGRLSLTLAPMSAEVFVYENHEGSYH